MQRRGRNKGKVKRGEKKKEWANGKNRGTYKNNASDKNKRPASVLPSTPSRRLVIFFPSTTDLPPLPHSPYTRIHIKTVSYNTQRILFSKRPHHTKPEKESDLKTDNFILNGHVPRKKRERSKGKKRKTKNVVGGEKETEEKKTGTDHGLFPFKRKEANLLRMSIWHPE